MCGIIGYVGNEGKIDHLLRGLEKLEYRGYDSVGLSIIKKSKITTFKSVGRVENLRDKIADVEQNFISGIGHTRWATHGVVSVKNSHPHHSKRKHISLVHNGIIDNYKDLKKDEFDLDEKFSSDTDSEVIVKLLEKYYSGNPVSTLKVVSKLLKGKYAIGVIFEDYPDSIYFAKNGSPLLIGLSNKRKMIASDALAIADIAKNIIYLEDGELGYITENSYKIYNKELRVIKKDVEEHEVANFVADKNDYEHFMLKEIYEQPIVIKNLIDKSIIDNKLSLNELGLKDFDIKEFDKIKIIACGSSYYAGLMGKRFIEKNLKIETTVHIASEFSYSYPIIGKNDLIIFISQSGETADCLSVLKFIKKYKNKTLSVVNVKSSSLAKYSDYNLFIEAGYEIGVASTKAFMAQVFCLYLFSIQNLKDNDLNEKINKIKKLPKYFEDILDIKIDNMDFLNLFNNLYNVIFIGREDSLAIAHEGALKLKEISYINSQSYAGGELKHGPLALIDEDMLTIAIVDNNSSYEKMVSNIEEIRARSGKILIIAEDDRLKDLAEHMIIVPKLDGELKSLLNIIPVQLIAYHVSKDRGLDVDKPRNLAKSVTVE